MYEMQRILLVGEQRNKGKEEKEKDWIIYASALLAVGGSLPKGFEDRGWVVVT